MGLFAKCTPIGCCQFMSHQCMNCCTDLVKPGHHVCVDANGNGMQCIIRNDGNDFTILKIVLRCCCVCWPRIKDKKVVKEAISCE